MSEEEPYLAVFVLVELTVHSDDLHIMDLLQVEADLVANFEAVCCGGVELQVGVISSELRIVVLNLASEVLGVVFAAHFISNAEGVEGKDDWAADAYFALQGGLDEHNCLPVGVAVTMLELIDELGLAEDADVLLSILRVAVANQSGVLIEYLLLNLLALHLLCWSQEGLLPCGLVMIDSRIDELRYLLEGLYF